MDVDDLIAMAKNDGFLEKLELEAKIAALKSLGCRILECIVYTKHNQECGLHDATDLVVNSPAWIDQKAAFIQHQEEQMQEFMEAAADDIEEVEQIITPEGSKTVFKMKSKNGSHK